MNDSEHTVGAFVSKGDKLLHQAIITGKVETVTVIETWLNPRDGGRTFIKVQDPCGREWKAYGSLRAGDDYSDFTVLEKSAGRGGFAKGMRT